MGLRDLARRALFEDEPQVTSPQTTTGTGAPPVVTAQLSQVPPSATVRQDLLARIRSEVFQRTPTAYTKLVEVADKMKQAIPDETTRLRAAIPVAGVTQTEIKAALAQHLQALHGVRHTFAQDAQRSRNDVIEKKKARRAEIAEHVAKMEQEVAGIRREDAALAGEIAVDEARFTQLEADFQATAQQLEAELSAASRIETLF